MLFYFNHVNGNNYFMGILMGCYWDVNGTIVLIVGLCYWDIPYYEDS